MKWIRKTHLYLGCFFTPMLLFYILTGWYQTVNTERLKAPSEATSFLQKARTVHVDQIYPGENEFNKPSNPKAFQFLVILMSLAGTATIGLGVFLAFKTIRPKWALWATLGGGILIPMLMLWIGQG
ncbi:MAG: hypothetical protein ACPGVU_23730 [Limisphaerales bacterium]